MDPGKEPTDPGKEPTDPAKEPSDPAKEPSDPGKEPTDPDKEPSDPDKEPADPAKEPSDPDKKPKDPGNEPTGTSKEPTDPSKEPTDPDKQPKDLDKQPTDPDEKLRDLSHVERIQPNEELFSSNLRTTLTSMNYRILDTSSSLVARKNFFNNRHTIYIPDVFFILFYISVFLTSAIMDRGLIFLIFCNGKQIFLGFLYALFSLTPGIYFLLTDDGDGRFMENYRLYKFFTRTFKIFFIFFGLDSVFIGCKVLAKGPTDAYMIQSLAKTVRGNAYYFFYISDDKLSNIKICCLVNTVGKSIPQLFLACLFISEAKELTITTIVSFICMMTNIVIFSLTMAVTFPIRKRPKILANSTCVILNSFTKFMATTCACCLTLCVFMYIYMYIGLKAFFIYFGWFFASLFPCYQVLTTPPNLFPNKLHLLAFTFFFSVIFTFIYIHPFERRGKFLYYYFHFVSLLMEIAAIYLITDAETDVVIIYISLKILIIGFKSCCRLTNVLHKVVHSNKTQP